MDPSISIGMVHRNGSRSRPCTAPVNTSRTMNRIVSGMLGLLVDISPPQLS